MDESIVAGSESKKRRGEEFEELQEFEPKRAKIKDLESVFRSEGKLKINTTPTLDLNTKDDTSHLESGTNYVKSRGFPIDLNSEDVSSSMIHDPFYPYKNYNHVKPRDSSSECGSTSNLGQERDSMRVWKQMKQNGFLSSSSHGGVSVPQIPKSRGRKKGNESVIKKKIEIAKKEQVDRFAKVAAPSGLLNELNPGIINHVRNRKQVHSIIENLVRSARKDNKSDEINDGNDSMVNKCEDDVLALKLSSSTTMSSLSNEESGNVSTVNSLSIKAASVASQWLELVHQDIKGRLAALKRSKKRVQAVIQTELPLLVSQELISYQENDNSQNDLHRKRWSTLFDQMENALSQEEKQLESSLNQVNEMLMHCENGLQNRTTANDCRYLKAETSPYQDLAVQAAAAAIYSTSNFLQSMENLPCF